MPTYQPAPARRPDRRAGFCLGALIGVPALYLAIQAFFGAMPLVERFGRFVCHHLIGGGL